MCYIAGQGNPNYGTLVEATANYVKGCVCMCGYIKQLPNDVFDMENGQPCRYCQCQC